MKIKYKYEKATKKLIINWEEGEVSLLIEEDEDKDFNELYDFIIKNMDEIEFENTTEEDLTDDSVAYLAFEKIMESIKDEFKSIKKELKKLSEEKTDV